MYVPLGFRVLVRPDKEKLDNELGKKVDGGYITDGGIFVADKSETVQDVQREYAAQEFGTLIAIGDIAWMDYGDERPWAAIGDKVAFKKYAGTFVSDPATDEQLILLNDNDIIARIEE